MFPSFGLNIDPYDSLDLLKEEIDDITKGGEKIDSISYRILKDRNYFRAFGLLQVDDVEKAPLESVSVLAKENVVHFGPMQRQIWRYKSYNIKELFQLSLFEFLDCPKHVSDYLLMLATDEMSKGPPKTLTKTEIDKLLRGRDS